MAPSPVHVVESLLAMPRKPSKLNAKSQNTWTLLKAGADGETGIGAAAISRGRRQLSCVSATATSPRHAVCHSTRAVRVLRSPGALVGS